MWRMAGSVLPHDHRLVERSPLPAMRKLADRDRDSRGEESFAARANGKGVLRLVAADPITEAPTECAPRRPRRPFYGRRESMTGNCANRRKTGSTGGNRICSALGGGQPRLLVAGHEPTREAVPQRTSSTASRQRIHRRRLRHAIGLRRARPPSSAEGSGTGTSSPFDSNCRGRLI